MRPIASYRDWRNDVDDRLYRIYCITIEDAGIDEDRLVRHWQSNESPCAFVRGFGDKHDLISRASVGLPTFVKPSS
jgi:hypothetical protein